MTIICSKYRLYPTKAQETALIQTLDICRQVYNSLVNERKALYEITGKSPSCFEQMGHFTEWCKIHHELKTVYSQVLRDVAVRVDLAFKAFFRRVKAGETPGYPRMKGEGIYDSITFPQLGNGGAAQIKGDCLQVSRIGLIPCKVHRPLIGTPKTCTIRRQSGKWFACFACECEPVPLPTSSESIGIDAGLEKFAALSDGSFVENPRFFRRDEKALAKAQRKQSKQKKGSPSRRKANKVLSRIHERIRNRRHNFVHQLARRLVNQYGLIAVEKLNVKNMVQNHCLAKSISDASWSQFRTVLSNKAESAGRVVAEIDPAYTSQDCHQCGHRAKKKLSERWHNCPMCGASLNRDTNAAINILNKAAVGTHSVTGIPV